jgi:hypothetical protein
MKVFLCKSIKKATQNELGGFLKFNRINYQFRNIIGGRLIILSFNVILWGSVNLLTIGSYTNSVL